MGENKGAAKIKKPKVTLAEKNTPKKQRKSKGKTPQKTKLQKGQGLRYLNSYNELVESLEIPLGSKAVDNHAS